MKPIKSTDYSIFFENDAYTALNQYLQSHQHSSVFILVDNNTKKFCLPHFLNRSQLDQSTKVITVEAGEIFKNLDTCTKVWNELSEKGADRKSLLINLGGGVVTDMGGFIASCFKRGIKFINIPTTLLSMVDASVGGKTGVDLGTIKNQIGLFSNPEMVLIDTAFLHTVSDRELRSGLAEIIKYGLTFDIKLWDKIKSSIDSLSDIYPTLIHRSIEIKNEVVLKDLHENDLRKSLNFGHTIGHAIESYFLEQSHKTALTHGEAIAIGMVIELYYSHVLLNLPITLVNDLKSFVKKCYGEVVILQEDFNPIIDLMKYDKKNVGSLVNFVLLEKEESCKLDVTINPDLLIEGISYYLD